MTTPSLDTYYNRMSSSLGDKKSVLPWVQEGPVLDVGCGSGDLLTYLTDHTSVWPVYGIDPSFESIERNTYPEQVREAYADQAHLIFPKHYFSTIICSSVFHEVFSYGNQDQERGRLQSVSNALHSLYEVLEPGGRLIIRDGVRPNVRGEYSMRVDDPEAVRKFLIHSPFHRKKRLDRQIYIYKGMEPNMFYGSASSLMEFAFTYTWGPESFEREVQEFYGLFSLNAYSRMVEAHGFRNIEKFSYSQEGYQEHLKDKVEFIDMPFPDTNAIWVYEKC